MTDSIFYGIFLSCKFNLKNFNRSDIKFTNRTFTIEEETEMSNEELKKELGRQRNFILILVIVILCVGFFIISKIQRDHNPIIGKTIGICFTEPVEITDLVAISDPAKRHKPAKVVAMIRKENGLGDEEDVLPSYHEILVPILSLKKAR